ncbi:MAG TPA: hypothetical protein VM695_10095 [Phycisphaerae bacterium]|nr:hypothetical protein [Phycisphaerae bacterium]
MSTDLKLLVDPKYWQDALTPEPLMFAPDGEAHAEANGTRRCEYVVYIEYFDGKPSSVITESRCLHRDARFWKPGDPEAGLSSSTYDFNESKAYGECYYSKSGGGPSEHVVNPPLWAHPVPPRGAIWLAEGLLLAHNPTAAELLTMGNKLLASPLVIDGWRNPFDGAVEGETVWCQVCRDHLPSEGDSPCKHLIYCRQGCGHVYLKDHRGWDDDPGGKHEIHCIDCGKPISQWRHRRHRGLCAGCDY